jgi:hypothetical protein
MRARAIGLAAAAGVALLGGTLWLLGPQAETAGEAESGVAQGARPLPRFVRPFVRPRGWLDPAHDDRSGADRVAPGPGDPGAPDPEDALVAFEGALAAMDEALAAGKTSRRTRRDLYVRATGAFTALSLHLDANDPEQRALLEDAHAEMKHRMRELRLSVPDRAAAHRGRGGS